MIMLSHSILTLKSFKLINSCCLFYSIWLASLLSDNQINFIELNPLCFEMVTLLFSITWCIVRVVIVRANVNYFWSISCVPVLENNFSCWPILQINIWSKYYFGILHLYCQHGRRHTIMVFRLILSFIVMTQM